MKKKKSSVIQDAPPIRESWEIWDTLTKNAGLDTVYYDNEFLNGNTSFNGLSHYLGFKVDKKTITEKLKKHKVSAEKFIGAFFKVLQPYAQMINDLCVFFSDHKVKKTNESLKIVFDFGNVSEQLDFNLENFRSILLNYTKVRKKVTFYQIPNIWNLHEIFGPHSYVDKVNIGDKKATTWLESYREGKISKPELTFKPTGYKGLDLQLQRVLDLWADFVNTCRTYTENVNELWGKLFQAKKEQKDIGKRSDEYENAANLTLEWSINNLQAESDHWSATMIELFYRRLQSLSKMLGADKDDNAADLEESLQNYFESLPKNEKEYDDVVEELTELLNLPVWKKRYELFSTWIFSVMDQALENHKRKVHDLDGVLVLSFSKTLLMSVESETGPFELWAENRTQLTNPTGHGRKGGIQPDYTIYRPTVGNPADCIACVEVKQYRKASVKNFRNALNDYARGLPKAKIFLVNYGPAPVSLKLDHPDRSSYYGGIQPSTASLTTFKTALLASLPQPMALSKEEVLQRDLKDLSIETLYIDVSGSMDNDIFKEYIRACITDLLKRKQVNKMIAFDEMRQHEWIRPCEGDLDSLFFTHFYGGWDHDLRRLKADSHSLVVTDRTGAKEIYESGSRPIVIMLEDDNAELWTYVVEKNTYVNQATETLDTLTEIKDKGFPGWLYPAKG